MIRNIENDDSDDDSTDLGIVVNTDVSVSTGTLVNTNTGIVGDIGNTVDTDTVVDTGNAADTVIDTGNTVEANTVVDSDIPIATGIVVNTETDNVINIGIPVDSDGGDHRLPNHPVSGSFLQSYYLDALAANLAKSSAIAMLIPLMTMTKLNQALAGVLVVSPLISNLLMQIPMTWRVNKNGAHKEGMTLVTFTWAGMTSLTILFAAADMTTVDRFDWRYATMLLSGFLIGLGSGTSLLMIDTLKWVSKKSYIPNLQLLFSFLVDSSSVTTPLITYFLSKFGFYVPFSLYSGLTLVGGVIGLGLWNASPYQQFKKQFPHSESRQLAVESGQLDELIKDYDNVSFLDMVRENLSVLCDRRSLLLGFTLFASLGSFFVSRTVLPRLLTSGFGLTTDEAIVVTSLGNLITILARPAASKMILYLDSQSGGVKVHLFGCALAIIGSTSLAVANLPRWGLYSSLAMNNLGFGTVMATPISIATEWSKPADSNNIAKVNPSTMFGLFGTLGSLGGILLPIFLGLLVDQSGQQWYKQYFYIIVAMMLVSAIGVPIVNYQVNRKPDDSIFKSAVSFFGKTFNVQRQEQYMVRNEAVADLDAQEPKEKIFVEAFL